MDVMGVQSYVRELVLLLEVAVNRMCNDSL